MSLGNDALQFKLQVLAGNAEGTAPNGQYLWSVCAR